MKTINIQLSKKLSELNLIQGENHIFIGPKGKRIRATHLVKNYGGFNVTEIYKTFTVKEAQEFVKPFKSIYLDKVPYNDNELKYVESILTYLLNNKIIPDYNNTEFKEPEESIEEDKEEENIEEETFESFDYDKLSQEEREEIANSILNGSSLGYLKGNRQWYLSISKLNII